MFTTKTRIMVTALAGAVSTAAGFLTYNAMSKKSKKNSVLPAVGAGSVAAAVGAAFVLLDIYVLEKDLGAALSAVDAAIAAGKPLTSSGSVSGMGLINAQRVGLIDAQRMGLYMPAPTVKKFSSFTGTRYFS